MRCVGYRQAWQFLEASATRLSCGRGIAATRLAKRQFTWLRATEAASSMLRRPASPSRWRHLLEASVDGRMLLCNNYRFTSDPIAVARTLYDKL